MYCRAKHINQEKNTHSLKFIHGQYFCDNFVLHCDVIWFTSIVIIVVRPPWVRCEFHAELPLVLFCSHKQRCWTVLSELWYEVASNLNNFFLSWKQRTAVKVVENAWQYFKMYAAGVWAKTAKGYFKTVDEQVILLQSKVCIGAIYSASKTKKYLSKNSTIGNRLLF